MQDVDLYQPIVATRVGPPPIALRVVTRPSDASFVGGVPQSSTKNEVYVLLSALPEEIQARVRTAIQVLIAGR